MRLLSFGKRNTLCLDCLRWDGHVKTAQLFNPIVHVLTSFNQKYHDLCGIGNVIRRSVDVGLSPIIVKLNVLCVCHRHPQVIPDLSSYAVSILEKRAIRMVPPA